jgi:Mg-chelatase subunit ChlD
MVLQHPIWLFLLIPVVLALWRWPMPSRLLFGLRCLGLTLLLLALCGLALRLPSRAGTIIVVADRSLSMPEKSDVALKEAIDLLHDGMSDEDRLGVVAFGQTAAVEQTPQREKFPGFVHDVGGDGSNLADALDKALSLIPADAPGKVLVLSDGRWTGRDPTSVVARAASRSLPIDYRPLARSTANDLAIARIEAPQITSPDEAFLITAWVQSPTAQTVDYTLRRDGKVLSAGKQALSAGLNRLTFRDRAGRDGGTQSYTLDITGAAEDPVPENNTARVLVGVQGPRPVLHVTTGVPSGLAKLLRAGGLSIREMPPEACTWSIEELSRYSCVLLENIPTEKIGLRGMETLATWVQQTGSGLMITGGKRSYGQGGYYKSPLEPIMPVSMERRDDHRKISVAIVVVLDRSGSMAIVVNGRPKMDLANAGTVQVLDLLGPLDEFGCIAVDTIPHEIAPLAPVASKEPARSNILKIESMGGGIFIYVALEAAAKMIAPATAGTKHIILFADADDSEEPGHWEPLVQKCRDAGITISVIGLGTERDKDAKLLKDIAAAGGGRIFFTDKPEELPRLFAEETFVVARNTFIDEPVKVKATPRLAELTGREFNLEPAIGGYNLCYLRDTAKLAAVSQDEYDAPIVAAWQAGSGRVLCYTGEADGKYAGNITRWPEVGHYFTSLVRWTAGQSGNLPKNMMLTQEVRNGVGLVQLHLDPERKGEPFTTLPRVNVMTARPGQAPESKQTTLRWVGPDMLAAEVPLSGTETALATVEVPGADPVALPPVTLPYSPEFQPAEGDRGIPALERMARATGGKERVELPGVWKELPRRPRYISIARWLLLAAVLLLVLEVLERRTGLLSRQTDALRDALVAARAARPTAAVPQAPAKPARSAPVPTPSRAPAKPAPTAGAESTPAPSPPIAVEPMPEAGVLEALRKARQRTRGRPDIGNRGDAS